MLCFLIVVGLDTVGVNIPCQSFGYRVSVFWNIGARFRLFMQFEPRLKKTKIAKAVHTGFYRAWATHTLFVNFVIRVAFMFR